jgi:hypothetical protein
MGKPVQKYPIASMPTRAEFDALGLDIDATGRRERILRRAQAKRLVRAVSTRESRPPRKGEWYLSGAVVEAYKAPSDLPAVHRIARLVVDDAARVVHNCLDGQVQFIH